MSEWRPVVGWEGLYEVSDGGEARSLPRVIIRSDGRRQPLRGRVLKPAVDRDGYQRVHIGVKRGVHQLVVEAFIGPCPPGLEIRHLDGNPANNALSNLRYGTRSENGMDRVRHGTHHEVLKTHCKRGHPLAVPNLVANVARTGRRNCLACHRAFAYIHTHGGDLQTVSDEYYQQIAALEGS
jgi:hypothetical protein